MNIDDITYQIRGAIFEVNKVLGYGFLEKVYEKALMIELSLSVEICPLRRNEFGNGLRKIDRIPVRRGVHPVTGWQQRPTLWMRRVTA
jgi:hypothetical protein